MTQGKGPDQEVPKIDGETYDHIYIESWKATLKECETRLEPQDYESALETKSLDEFRNKLRELEEQYEKRSQKHVIMLLYPTLDHYEQFARSFVQMMSEKVETSMLWGLLSLVIKLSLESKGTIDRVSTMLEDIGHKLQRLHQCALVIPTGYVEIMDDATKVHREIIGLWLNIIGIFRDQGHDAKPAGAIEELTSFYQKAMRTIGDAITRVENLAETAERQMRMIDHGLFQKYLERKEEGESEQGQLPCCMLPYARNRKFFGRQHDLEEIEKRLQPTSEASELRSVALWGMGGIGKTQCALAYGYSQQERLDAIFWVAAETALTIQQGFSRFAYEGLRLPNTTADALAENSIRFQNWLTRTTAKWLLIFDNVEDHQLLAKNWPVARQGAILITTRRPGIASLPVDTGVELKVFTHAEGAQLLYSLVGKRAGSINEDKAAIELSHLLNGYPLAINQMAAYIMAKNMRIEAFVKLYQKFPQKIHREKKAGWKYVGYDHALDTVWEMSFDLLTEDARSLLSTLSFLDPDEIPLQLLDAATSAEQLEHVNYLEDELVLWDAIEAITGSALVRNDSDSQCLSIHRLVRAETLFRLTSNERQVAFDTAVKLLRNDFPSRGLSAPRLDLWEAGAKYLPHVVTLANDWHDSQRRLEPLNASVDLCELMCDANFFVQDNDPASVLSLSANVAGEALEKLPADQRPKELEASIYETISYRDLKEGAFKSAGQLAQKALTIRLELVGPNDMRMVTAYNLVALATDSECNYDEAEPWWQKTVGLTVDKTDEEARRLNCRDNLNFSRNRYCRRDFSEAEKRLNLSLAAARTFEQNWHVDASIYQTFTSLYIRSGNQAKAKYYADLAQRGLDETGGQATTSWVAYLCAHRSAQVAIMQNKAADAIEFAIKATTMGRLYKVTTSMLARSTHLLCNAYTLDPSYEAEAKRARIDAQRLRELLPPGRTNLNDESDEAYDKLVDIIQR